MTAQAHLESPQVVFTIYSLLVTPLHLWNWQLYSVKKEVTECETVLPVARARHIEDANLEST